MGINEELAVLREVAPFSILGAKKLKLLAFVSELVTYEAGDIVLKQGDEGDAVFVMIDGLIDVSISTSGVSEPVREMGRHSFFGEIAIMKKTVRAATVQARTDIVALRISKDVLYQIIEEEPELGALLVDHIEKAGYTFS